MGSASQSGGLAMARMHVDRLGSLAGGVETAVAGVGAALFTCHYPAKIS